MQHRVRGRLQPSAIFLFAACALCACGGGGGGTPITPSGPTATPRSAQSPPSTQPPQSTSSTTFSASPAPASVTLPSGSAVSGAIMLPVITGSGTVTLTTYSSPPSAVPILNVRSRRVRAAAASGTSLNTALLYYSLTSSQAITLQGAPGFGLNLSTAPNGNVYLAQYSGQWNSISTAAAFQGTGVTVVAASLGPQNITIAAGQTMYFAVFVSQLSGINIALTAPLAIASPGAYSRIAVQPYDAYGNPISGNLPQPLSITDLDTSGHTSIPPHLNRCRRLAPKHRSPQRTLVRTSSRRISANTSGSPSRRKVCSP